MSKQSSSVRGALQPGTALREYRIEAVLGYGGYGVVYHARHGELGHEVAIKEYLPADLSVREAGTVYPRSPDCTQVYEDGKRRFLEEAKRSVQFKTDPGVVTCTDFFRANGTAYLVMEYIEGLSLAALLKERETAGRAFDEGDLKSVAVPLLETLLRLHRAGVLHRDIKPSNILIRRSDGQPVLIDFGAAKQMTADHTKSAAPYTEGYAAFEQVGEGELGPWTDVYAFGAVLWRMVAGGKPPWEPPNPKRVELRVAAEMAGKPDPQPAAAELGEGRFSDELLAAIDRSLIISADKRPRDLEDLRYALDGPSQSGDMPEPPSDSVPDPRSPSDWLFVASASVCVALIIGVWEIDGTTSDRSLVPEIEAKNRAMEEEPESPPPAEPFGRPKVRMETSSGTMILELYPDQAPETVKNFLQYVDDGFYDRTIFHRVIPNFVIQGGGFTESIKAKPTRPAIQNEAGVLSNLRYTIAMARTSHPHSATAQFFINHQTNRGLDKDEAEDGWGYCVFGRVVEGKEIVESIASVWTGSRAGHEDVPRTPVLIKSVERIG